MAKFVRFCCHILKVVNGISALFVITSKRADVTLLLEDILVTHFGILSEYPWNAYEEDPFGERYELHHLVYRTHRAHRQFAKLFEMARAGDHAAPAKGGVWAKTLGPLKPEPELLYERLYDEEDEVKQSCFTIVLEESQQSLCLGNGFLVGARILMKDYRTLDQFAEKKSRSMASVLERGGY